MNGFEIQLTATQANASDIPALLKCLFQPSSDNYFKLSYEIQREFKAGGSPEVTRMDFDRVNYDPGIRKGNFRVVLDINFTFGCEDVITEKEGQTSEWTFAIDNESSIMALYASPYIDSRTTADEF
jgi:hypothetical protein